MRKIGFWTTVHAFRRILVFSTICRSLVFEVNIVFRIILETDLNLGPNLERFGYHELPEGRGTATKGRANGTTDTCGRANGWSYGRGGRTRGWTGGRAGERTSSVAISILANSACYFRYLVERLLGWTPVSILASSKIRYKYMCHHVSVLETSVRAVREDVVDDKHDVPTNKSWCPLNEIRRQFAKESWLNFNLEDLIE